VGLGGVAVGGRGPRGGQSVEICAGESRVVWAVGWRSRDGDDSGSVEICAGESRVVWAVGWRSRDGDDSGSVEICAGESRVVWAVGWRSRDGDDSGRDITGKKMTGHVPAFYCV
jgi:hypothetical protein